MSRISRDQVAHIAGLARLMLSDRETDQMAQDLDQILDYVATLEELDTSGIEATAHALPLETPLRPDEAVPGIDPGLAVATAPQSEGFAFVVPKVIEGEEG
jgi:aspartyl-tRNA(Asn)/glutamyl-tRNA(Gln) amidotransferase subunit C